MGKLKYLVLFGMLVLLSTAVNAGVGDYNTLHHDVNVIYPSAVGSYWSPGTVDVNLAFTYFDENWSAGDDVNFSIYVSIDQNSHDEAIVEDLNASLTYCTGAVFSTTVTCQYTWSTASGLADGNYMIDINVSTRLQGTPADINSVWAVSDFNFALDQTTTDVTISSPSDGAQFGPSTTSIAVSYSATDANSSVKKYWVSVDTAAVDGYIDNGTDTSYTFSGLRKGGHTFNVKYQDLSDNNSAVASVNVRIRSPEGGTMCGNSNCETGEDASNCPRDCTAVCGDDACTHTESNETCPADCGPAVVCGDGTCSSTENHMNCLVDCPAPPGIVRQTIREKRFTGKPTADEIAAVLTEAGASQNAIEKASEAVGKTSVERNIKVEEITDEQGNVSYVTTISIGILNHGGAKLKTVRVIEYVPKEVANAVSEISSNLSFEVLKDDPIIRFDAGELNAGENKQIEYTVEVAVTEEQFALFSQPITSEAEEEQGPPPPPSCIGVICDDKNPCTDDSCVQGECYQANKADGTACGYGKECRTGTCIDIGTEPPIPPVEPDGLDLTTIILAIIVVVIIIGGAYYYYIMPKK